VKFRAESTTSERQLALAMASAGRPVSLRELSNWRKDGLLPPLASHGLGSGKGKSYYWREDDIVANACATFDLLGKYGRADTVACMLWLLGFRVPLPQLRRAWKHRCRLQPGPAIRTPAESFQAGDLRDFLGGLEIAGDLPCLLLNIALNLTGPVAPDRDGENREIVALLDRALARLLRHNAEARSDIRLAEQLLQMIRIVGAALEASELVAKTPDADMHEAQHYMCVAARLLRDSSGAHDLGDSFSRTLPWSPRLAESLGPPLFLLILVMLRSGRRPALQRAAEKIESMGRQWHAVPAQLQQFHA
jgi:hypothetical protein